MSKNEQPKEYLGRFMRPEPTEKEKRKQYRHPIFLYSPDEMEQDDKLFSRLQQVVNVYEHNVYDFIYNSKKIIDHYKKYYGATSIGIFTMGQGISFRVYKDQKEPFQLSLYSFFINYAMLPILIISKADMRNWSPWVPFSWSNSEWVAIMNSYIKKVRNKGNSRWIGELLEVSKFIMTLWCSEAGDRLALSISNDDIIDLMHKSEEAYKSITCTFDIPEDITPGQLEKLTSGRFKELSKLMASQTGNPMSIYAKNGLFNPKQAREFFVHITHKPDLNGHTIPYTYPTNTIMGTKDVRAHMIDAYGGRKAEILKLNVSDAGTLERSLSMMCSQLRYVDINYECDSNHFRTRKIDSVDTLDKLDGRVCKLDLDKDEYLIIDPDNVSLIGKTVYLKTPITCTHPDRDKGVICSACYGKLMSNLNCDIHIGRLAALNSADDTEQNLLSAKHALDTNTQAILFNDEFSRFFDQNNCTISFNTDMVNMSIDRPDEFENLYFEFYLSTMIKHKDGEGRMHDRGISEIIVWNKKTDERTVIKDENGAELFLSQEFVKNHFLHALQFVGKSGIVRIPFSELIDTGTVMCEEIFDFDYSNVEIADALNTLIKIMNNTTTMGSFVDYNEALDILLPLFSRGGVHIPELQCEILISQMCYTPEGKMVNWNDPDPVYQLFPIKKSIHNLKSVLTSILYDETAKQIAGAHHAYEKSGTSGYDHFLLDQNDKSSYVSIYETEED